MDKKIDFSKIYSPSKLEMFFRCPKSYHFHYLDPIYSSMKSDLKKQPQNIFKFHTLGKAVHNAITLFYHLPLPERTEKALKKNLEKTWVSEAQRNKKPPLGKWGGFKTLEEERNSYRQALSMLKNFFKVAEIDLEIEYLPTKDFKNSIEDYLGLITPLNDQFDISGKFDLVVRDKNDFLQVVDYKTGGKEEKDEFQLKFYKVLAEANFEKPVARTSFYYLRLGKKKYFDLEKESAEKIKKEILEKIEKIKSAKKFATRPNKLCQFCLFRSFCPEKNKVGQIIQKTKDEDYSGDSLPF